MRVLIVKIAQAQLVSARVLMVESLHLACHTYCGLAVTEASVVTSAATVVHRIVHASLT